MSKVYFRCVIMSITDAQDMQLRRMCERPLARKLGLGSNFPRKIMYGRVTAMGVGIFSHKTAISSSTLKLHSSHKRMNSENGFFLKIIDNNSIIEQGQNEEAAEIIK